MITALAEGEASIPVSVAGDTDDSGEEYERGMFGFFELRKAVGPKSASAFAAWLAVAPNIRRGSQTKEDSKLDYLCGLELDDCENLGDDGVAKILGALTGDTVTDVQAGGRGRLASQPSMKSLDDTTFVEQQGVSATPRITQFSSICILTTHKQES